MAYPKMRVFINFLAIIVFSYGSLSKAQDNPSAPEMRNLILMGVFGAYYCDVFKGKKLDFATVKSLLAITNQEESDPVLDNLGQYLEKRMKSYSPSCTMKEYGNNRDSMLQDIFEEWAKQSPEGQGYFPFAYNFLGI